MPVRSSDQPSASSAVLGKRVFVWIGGVLFVASLAASAYAYLVRWSGPPGATGGLWQALAVDAALIALFATHHSLFARDRVKRWLERYVPDDLLRSVYVWIASLLWLVVVAAWQPIGGSVYERGGTAAIAHAVVQLSGLWLIVRSVRAIDALELAGIRRNPAAGALQVRGPYRLVRHPLYLGWMLVVFGAARMTGDRAAFAVLTSLYLIVAVLWEERSLERTFGDAYRRYKAQVRWRIVPLVY